MEVQWAIPGQEAEVFLLPSTQPSSASSTPVNYAAAPL
jgi:hypothetical protein